MQHKRRRPKSKLLLALLAAAVVVFGISLMMTNIPAPSQPVEKQLDAKAFLEPKQQ